MLRKNSRKARRERLLKAFIKLQHSPLKRSRLYAVCQILQGADAAPSSSSSSPASVGSATSELSSDSEPVIIRGLAGCCSSLLAAAFRRHISDKVKCKG